MTRVTDFSVSSSLISWRLVHRKDSRKSIVRESFRAFFSGNAQVEFYNLAKKTGVNDVQLPCTGNADQLYSGSGIEVDPVNKLFLVAQTYDACSGGTDGVIAIYDESGNLVETITGFPGFAIAEPAPALNPGTRTGWALTGSGFSQLQQFSY